MATVSASADVSMTTTPTFGTQVDVPGGKLPPGIPADFGATVDQAWKEGQDHDAQLVPNARHIAKTDSGHNIQLEQPRLVIEAIRQVVVGVRHPATWYDLTSCCAK